MGLLNTIDSAVYLDEFKKRFKNFCEKSPVLLSFITAPKGVQIIDEVNDKVYDIDWQFSVPVKSFIFGIKQILISKGCYPTFVKETTTEVKLTHEEQLALASKGVSLDELPETRTVTTSSTFVVDKVIIHKDVFIIKELETGDSFRYQMKQRADVPEKRYSSVFFLKRLRSGKYSPAQSGEYFFEHADLLNEVTPVQDREDY